MESQENSTWIRHFLKNRSQCVVINGTKSYKSEVLSDVPHGTVLGPLLFLIYTNDLHCCITESFVSGFADDTRIKKAVSSTSDAHKLQEDLNHVKEWSSDSKFEFTTHYYGDAKLLKHLPWTSEYYEYKTHDGVITYLIRLILGTSHQ